MCFLQLGSEEQVTRVGIQRSQHFQFGITKDFYTGRFKDHLWSSNTDNRTTFKLEVIF